MISKSEFDVLTMLKQNPQIDEITYHNQLRTLFNDKLIEYNITGENQKTIFYHGFNVTPKGNRAYEEYLNFLKAEDRETETLNLAKEANEISKIANKRAHNANVVSIIALIGSLLISIIGIIASNCF